MPVEKPMATGRGSFWTPAPRPIAPRNIKRTPADSVDRHKARTPSRATMLDATATKTIFGALTRILESPKADAKKPAMAAQEIPLSGGSPVTQSRWR
jgi:hypothetical protein